MVQHDLGGVRVVGEGTGAVEGGGEQGGESVVATRVIGSKPVPRTEADVVELVVGEVGTGVAEVAISDAGEGLKSALGRLGDQRRSGVFAFIEEMEAPWIREELEPTLEGLNVDIVFNGHNHLFNHTPTTPGGITWVTTGGAGGMLDTDSAIWKVADWPEIETQLHVFHYVRVDVADNVMTVNAIGIDGSTLHSFSLSN